MRGKIWALAFGLLLLAGSVLPAAASVGTVSIWQARLGSGGANGTVTISTNSSGTGTLSVSAKRLRAGTSYAVAAYRATCSRPGSRILSLAAQRATSAGVISKKFTLTASQVRALFAVAGPRNLRLGAGSNARCGAFSVLPVTTVMPLGATVLVPPDTFSGAFHIHTALDFVRYLPDESDFGQPDPGKLIVSVLVDLESFDVTNSTTYNPFNYTLRDRQGYEYDPTFLSGQEPELSSGELGPDGFVRGWVSFEVPEHAAAAGFRLIYAPFYGRLLTVELGAPDPPLAV